MSDEQDPARLIQRNPGMSDDIPRIVGGEDKTYDAFICWSSDCEMDRQFLYQLIDELEVKGELKLFIPGRDDPPGSTITAYIILKRCRRVVILLSRQFMQGTAGDFVVKFAHVLPPAARSKTLIPVIREGNTPLPRSLRFLDLCDFTRSGMNEGVWDKLSAAIVVPSEDGSNPFDESLTNLKFPTPKRLDGHNE